MMVILFIFQELINSHQIDANHWMDEVVGELNRKSRNAQTFSRAVVHGDRTYASDAVNIAQEFIAKKLKQR